MSIPTFNSYQDLLTSTTGEFGSAIKSGTPAELGAAATVAIQKHNMEINAPAMKTTENISVRNSFVQDVQALADATARWDELAETNPEEALSQLADDSSEINRAISTASAMEADAIVGSLTASLKSI